MFFSEIFNNINSLPLSHTHMQRERDREREPREMQRGEREGTELLTGFMYIHTSIEILIYN